MAAKLLEWLSARGEVAPFVILLLVFAESGLMLFIPGETAVFFGGVLAAQGDLSVLSVGLAAATGAILGDSTGYLFGRGPGRRRFERTGKFGLLRKRHIERIERLLARWGRAAVLLARFVPVGRVAGPFAFGLCGVRPSGFFPFALLSALVWAIGFTAIGYLAGDAWEGAHRWLGRASLLLLAATAATLAVALAVRRFRASRRPPAR